MRTHIVLAVFGVLGLWTASSAYESDHLIERGGLLVYRPPNSKIAYFLDPATADSKFRLDETFDISGVSGTMVSVTGGSATCSTGAGCSTAGGASHCSAKGGGNATCSATPPPGAQSSCSTNQNRRCSAFNGSNKCSASGGGGAVNKCSTFDGADGQTGGCSAEDGATCSTGDGDSATTCSTYKENTTCSVRSGDRDNGADGAKCTTGQGPNSGSGTQGQCSAHPPAGSTEGGQCSSFDDNGKYSHGPNANGICD